MIIPDRAAAVNPFSQTFLKTLRISMIIAKEGHMPFTLSPQQGADLPPIQRLAAGGETGPPGPGDVRHDMACAMPPSGGGDVGAHRRGQKGARAPYGSLAPS